MKAFLIVLLFLVSPLLSADDLYMVRSALSFPEAMALLQETIREHGYQVSRVQRVDIGLTKSGYKTDKYRVVFFGKLGEVRELSDKYPELIPYMPLKIAIFAENEDTILLASGFKHLSPYYAGQQVQVIFEHWEKDVASMLESMRVAK